MTITFPDGPTITAEVAVTTATSVYGRWDVDVWDSALWGPDEVYTDLSAYLTGFESAVGFDANGKWRAGTGNLKFKNDDGRFSPDNPTSPYTVAGASGLLPWRPARVTATYAGTSYQLLRMQTGDWAESEPDDAPTASVPLRDEWARLGVKAIGLPSAGAGDTMGARMHRALDAVGHHGLRDIQAGNTTLQATTLPGECTRELELAADSEGGTVFYDPATGAVCGRDRYDLVTAPRSITPQAVFGTGGGSEISYTKAPRSTTTDRIVNSVSFQRVGGTVQDVEDPDSIARHVLKPDSRTDLMCQTDAQVLAMAQWIIATRATYQRGIESLTIWPQKDPTVMWPVALGLRLRDLVQVLERRSWGTITRLCHISGIKHSVAPKRWATTFQLTPAAILYALSSSRWDFGTWGASAADMTAARWL